jgi:anti-sigma B factor antagonist
MEISSNINGTTLTVVLSGRLDTTSAPELSDYLTAHRQDASALILDFEGIDYVSSAGLRVILATRKSLPQPGAFKLIHVSAEVMEVFEMTGFADILDIETA